MVPSDKLREFKFELCGLNKHLRNFKRNTGSQKNHTEETCLFKRAPNAVAQSGILLVEFKYIKQAPLMRWDQYYKKVHSFRKNQE